MTEIITVYYLHKLILVYKKVAERMKLRSGQALPTEMTMWYVISENARYGLDLLKQKRNESHKK